MSHDEKIVLGYNEKFIKGSGSLTWKEDEQKSYAEVVKESKKMQQSFSTQDQPSRRIPKQQPVDNLQEGSWRNVPQRRFSSFRYQTLFLGVFYSCNNFGHKVVNCKVET